MSNCSHIYHLTFFRFCLLTIITKFPFFLSFWYPMNWLILFYQNICFIFYIFIPGGPCIRLKLDRRARWIALVCCSLFHGKPISISSLEMAFVWSLSIILYKKIDMYLYFQIYNYKLLPMTKQLYLFMYTYTRMTILRPRFIIEWV